MDINFGNFANSLCVTPIVGGTGVGSQRDIEEIYYWLEQNVGKQNFSFGFEDYGQHGEWMLYTASREDLLAFKLRWPLC